MHAPSHFLAGAVICRHVPNRPLALGLAFVSHYALDAIPHFEHALLVDELLGAGFPAWWSQFGPAFGAIAVALAAAAYLRHGMGEGGRPRHAIWIIAAGGMAILPDMLCSWFGRESLAGQVNLYAHWWDPYFLGPWLTASGCFATMAFESLLVGVLAWALFRRPAASANEPPRRPQ